jgi:hypothetical protein
MNFSLRKYYLIICAICIVSFSAAQTELKNKVVDFATYAPIENASVYVNNTTIGTVSNVDGKFVLLVPSKHKNDTLVISSIGYKSFKTTVAEFDNTMDIFLEEDIASLDEILLVAETRPKTGNDVVLKAIERLEKTLPDSSYIQKGFLRHRERNIKQYKWLIESAITLYDSSYAAGSRKNLKINVDETRKSFDLRDIDSLFVYTSYLKDLDPDIDITSNRLTRDTIKASSLEKAIKWNDQRINGLDKLFKGKLNIVRNANNTRALFGKDVLQDHQFAIDTILVENEKKVYKIKISEGKEYVNLETPGIYDDGYHPRGWLYIDWDSYAIKKIEYELVPASAIQKRRSKSLFNSKVNHKLIITYREFEENMYPSYLYYETPKLVNIGNRSSDRPENETAETREEQYYFTIQEIVFTEIIQDDQVIAKARDDEWSSDIFLARPYNKEFWENYNTLLESEEEEKLIRDLTRRATLFKE